jgi:hypothetical protein
MPRRPRLSAADHQGIIGESHQEFDESLQRLFELKVKSSEADWTAIRAELHGSVFFHAGPLACPSDQTIVFFWSTN